MTKCYITEKYFVPERITRHLYNFNETEKGLYQIVYGILQYGIGYDEIYDLLVRLCKQQKSEVVKRFKLQAWKEEINAIINKLRMLDVKDKYVYVLVPFTDYSEDLRYTMNLFEFAMFTINEILDKGDAQMNIPSKPSYQYPQKDITKLICGYYETFISNFFPDEKSPEYPYYRSLLFDELIRRGVTSVPQSLIKYVQDLDVDEDGVVDLTPSEYYNQPAKFLELMDLDDEHKMLRVQPIQDEQDDANDRETTDRESSKKTYSLGQAGVVYFMLNDISKETVEKRKKKKMVSLINYYLGNRYDDDTARSYVDRFRQITPKSHSLKFYETVKKTLKDYNFDIPDVVDEGIKKKSREKYR